MRLAAAVRIGVFTDFYSTSRKSLTQWLKE
jgi:hypothetical protein